MMEMRRCEVEAAMKKRIGVGFIGGGLATEVMGT